MHSILTSIFIDYEVSMSIVSLDDDDNHNTDTNKSNSSNNHDDDDDNMTVAETLYYNEIYHQVALFAKLLHRIDASLDKMQFYIEKATFYLSSDTQYYVGAYIDKSIQAKVYADIKNVEPWLWELQRYASLMGKLKDVMKERSHIYPPIRKLLYDTPSNQWTTPSILRSILGYNTHQVNHILSTVYEYQQEFNRIESIYPHYQQHFQTQGELINNQLAKSGFVLNQYSDFHGKEVSFRWVAKTFFHPLSIF